MAEESWTLNVRMDETVVNTCGLSNAISTTKYSILTWLPKSLWEQFRRIANTYFVVISILMLIGTYATYLFVTPLDPFSTVMTLVFVLLVTSFKEGYEDLQRARSDRTENKRHVTVIRFENGVPEEKILETQFVKAGDIIKMTGTTQVPVDLLLIYTSMFADGNQCYIETANIDGETNLKLREAPIGVRPLVNSGNLTKDIFAGRIVFEPPNKNIHNFIGTFYNEAVSEPMPLSADNILLRSSLFSNTDWAYGIAIYTGQETKIQMNNRHAPSKQSKLEQYLNLAIIIIFFCQITLVTISVISIYILGFNVESKLPYIYPSNAESASILPLWLEQWFVFFLLYNNFIPISLYVTIEIVNLGQGLFISSDPNIYEESLDCPCVVRSSNLCQELGMVSNIFSDKTGTLTRNEMKFVKFVVDDKLYDIPWPTDSPTLNVPSTDTVTDESNLVNSFLQCLTICHTVVREKDGTYRAESPDELALIEGVGCFNCGLVERGTSGMSINVTGKRRALEVLAVNAFNSDRKRMSILVKDSTGSYFLMCKGADSTMLSLCTLERSKLAIVEKNLLDLACLGLRTLCIAQKRLDESAALQWLARHRAAAASLQNRAENLADVGSEIEQGLTLLGITAIEDRLQDEVPEVIADLAKAGIILWMLTGDKEETAVNIGRSCNLVLPDTKLFFLTKATTAEAYFTQLKFIHDNIVFSCSEDGKFMEDGEVREIVFVMDGPSFKYFDENDKIQRDYILRIGKACRAVIGCRLTPIQKQQVVGIVKKDSVPKATTLSIGDGANDVSMIREADVGVGIFGKEGRQAANNADFAIGQFKFLKRLLLVHGRWNYNRQSRVFLYSMHKNMVITLTLFWYSYYTAVSGTSMYQSWVYSFFNFLLGLPIIFYGMQDRDISDEFAMKNPQVYSTGRENTYLRTSAIGMWIWNAILYAIIICLVYYYAVSQTFEYFGLYGMGTTVYTGLVLALQFKVAYLHHQWTYPQVLVMSISVFGMFLYFIIISGAQTDFYMEAEWLYSQGIYWFFGMFSIPLFCGLLDFVGYDLFLFIAPTKEMLFREIEHRKVFVNDFLSLLLPKSLTQLTPMPPEIVDETNNNFPPDEVVYAL